MARQFNGTSDFLQSSSTVDLSSYNKVTIAFWEWVDNFDSSDRVTFELSDNWLSHTGTIIYLGNTSSFVGSIIAGTNGNAGLSFATYNQPSAAAWHQYVITFDYTVVSNQANIYVDGSVGSGASHTDAANSGNFGNFTFNFMSRNGGAFFESGRLAEFAIWPGVILDSNEIKALSNGFAPPLIRPSSLGWYWAFRTKASPEIELIKANGATVNGTSTVDHPRIIYPSPTIIGFGGGSNLVQVFDRVKESTTTTGTGTFTLLGAESGGFRAFVDTVGVSNRCYYCCQNSSAGEWEVGIGTLVTSSTLSRDIIRASSNGGSKVSFSSGTKDIFGDAPASLLLPMTNAGDLFYMSSTGIPTRLPIGNSGQVLTVSNGLPVWI